MGPGTSSQEGQGFLMLHAVTSGRCWLEAGGPAEPAVAARRRGADTAVEDDTALTRLKEGNRPVGELSHQLGYESRRHFAGNNP
jgi:hypothetical protein